MLDEVGIDASKSPLSAKENETFLLAAQGKLKPAIAAELERSLPTVKTHMVHVFQKLGVENIQQAISLGWLKGILVMRETLLLCLVLSSALSCITPSSAYASRNDGEPSREQPLRQNSRRGRAGQSGRLPQLRTAIRGKGDK